MANIRTLKLNLLADTKQFSKGMSKASGETDTFSSKLGSSMKSVAKNAAIAGAAVAGMAIAFGVNAVKAAMVDEKSQRRLAKALQNTTKASSKQIKSVEKYIAKTSLASGVIDDDLRPSFQKLVQSTKDIGKAQDLMTLALDTSAASGKDLQTVSLALAKGYAGNNASLGRLGLGLDQTTLKSKDFKKVQGELEKIVTGQSKAKANSFEGRIERFKIAIDEAKESIGYAIIEAIQPLADKWLPRIATTTQDVIDGFTGKGGKGEGVALGESIKNVTTAVGNFLGVFTGDSENKTKTFAETLQSVADAFNAIGEAIDNTAKFFDNFKKGWKGLTDAVAPLATFLGDTFKYQNGNNPERRKIGGGFKESPVGRWLANFTSGFAGLGGTRALGGAVTSRTPFLVGEHGAEIFVPSGNGRIVPNHALGGGTTIINLNGIVDAESARRTIEQLLQRSSIRTGAVNLQGSVL
jgi:hypothetical protein